MPAVAKPLGIRLVAGLALATILAVAAACGSSEPESAATEADYKRALAGAPAALASLYREGGQLLGGGPDAYQRRLAALEGHPVVVNKWASWCGPCRFEFPFFQKQVAKRGKQIAFLGLDAEDSRDGARRFLDKFPVPYPSFYDPKSEIAETFHGDRSFPTTVFYDRDGRVEYLKQGGYASEEALARDISRYAR
jgi:cytochrome c biogenesis protein CcmG, thiol:disulfide interchange protein DsbE